MSLLKLSSGANGTCELREAKLPLREAAPFLSKRIAVNPGKVTYTQTTQTV